MNQETRTCQSCKQSFNIEPQDFKFYEKMNVPAPTWCPGCRLQRRLVHRNERTLYRRLCDLCKKEIVSLYHKESPYVIYCKECWWSDKWNPEEHAKEYDFSRPFFGQFQELMKATPRIALIIKQGVASDYTNYSFANKNAYLCFAAHYNEDCAYLTYSMKNKDTFDGLHVSNSELAYNCNYVDRIYQSNFLQYCVGCSECTLGYNLRNCQNCFGCVNLRNKQYHIFNKAYSKEEYTKIVEGYTESFKSFTKAREQFEALKLKSVQPYSYQIKCVQCTGSDLEECKNLQSSFSTKYSEDSDYAYVNNVKIYSCKDVNNLGYDKLEYCYESQGVTGSYSVTFVDACWHNSFLSYSSSCFTSDHLFGCVSLKSKKYCILNKQYSKEEYEFLLPRIIKHMGVMPYKDSRGKIYKHGEFFPPEFSAFSYNETIAQEYFPLTKEQALEKGYNWKAQEGRSTPITLAHDKLPDSTKDISNSLLKETIGCEHQGECSEQCTKAFRFTPQELMFYKQARIPLPRFCPNCRHYQRLKKRNSISLCHRKCTCAGFLSDNKAYENTTGHFHKDKHCPNEFETTYAPERKEVVYCEPCYLAEVA